MILIKEHKIKKEFYSHFLNKMSNENVMPLFYEIFAFGTAYVVGGFFRDFLNNKASRDIDIIVDIENSKLIEIISNSTFKSSVNRQGGIKLKLNSIDLDIWSIENNWAFKNNLVKLNEEDKLNSIAKGCFYNYDSLVINLHNFSYNLKYYKDFLKKNELNILQEKSLYKNLNPSIEANILRAFYLKNRFGCDFTDNTSFYLIKKLGYLQDKYDTIMNRLIYIKSKYPKYSDLEDITIELYINELKNNFNPNNQYLINF